VQAAWLRSRVESGVHGRRQLHAGAVPGERDPDPTWTSARVAVASVVVPCRRARRRPLVPFTLISSVLPDKQYGSCAVFPATARRRQPVTSLAAMTSTPPEPNSATASIFGLAGPQELVHFFVRVDFICALQWHPTQLVAGRRVQCPASNLMDRVVGPLSAVSGFHGAGPVRRALGMRRVITARASANSRRARWAPRQ
jgi:hypothetical protein